MGGNIDTKADARLEMTGWRRVVLRMLLPCGRGALRSLMLTFVGEDPRILTRVDIDAAVARVETALSRIPLSFFLVYEFNVLMLEFSLPPLVWKWRRLSRLPLERRLRIVTDLENSRFLIIRSILKLLKLMALAGMMMDPAVLEWVGYGPAMQRREGRSQEEPRFS